MPSVPKWVAIISCDIVDSKRCSELLQSASGDILSYSSRKGNDTDASITSYIDSLQNCLRKVLQFWAKGSQNDQNQWNQTALILAASMLNLMTRLPRTDFSKCYKLTGFVLAKSSSMGEGDELFILVDSCTNFLLSQLESDPTLLPGVRSLLPVLLHTIADVATKQKASRSLTPRRHESTSRALRCVLQERVLTETCSEVSGESLSALYIPPVGSPVSNVANAALSWSLAAHTWGGVLWSTIHDIQTLAKAALCRLSLYHSIPRAIELLARHVAVLVSAGEAAALAILTRRTTLWLGSLQTAIQTAEDTTCVQFTNELNLVGRIALYWAYEVGGKASTALLNSADSGGEMDCFSIADRALNAACLLATAISERLAIEHSKLVATEDWWKWALMADVAAVEQTIVSSSWTDDSPPRPLHLLDVALVPLPVLSGIDKTLLSKLCIASVALDSEALQTVFPAAGPGSCAALIGCFIPASSHVSSQVNPDTKGISKPNSSPSELAAKLTVVCFQRVYLPSAELHLGVALQLSAGAMHILTFYAQENYPASASDPQLSENLAKYVLSSLHRVVEANCELSVEWISCLDALCSYCVECVLALNGTSGITSCQQTLHMRDSIRSRIVNIIVIILKLLEGSSVACRVVASYFLPVLLRIDECVAVSSSAWEMVADQAAKLILLRSINESSEPLPGTVYECSGSCPLTSKLTLRVDVAFADTEHDFTRHVLKDMTIASVMTNARSHLQELVDVGESAAYYRRATEFISALTNYLTHYMICDMESTESVRLQLLCDAYWTFSMVCLDNSGCAVYSFEQSTLDELCRMRGTAEVSKSSSKTQVVDGDHIAASIGFKASLLLMQFSYAGSPPSTLPDDWNIMSPSTSQNIIVHMSIAVSYWKQLAAQKMPPSSVLITFQSDVLQLLHFLGLYGYVETQISVLEMWSHGQHRSSCGVEQETFASSLLAMKCSLALWSCVNCLPTASFTQRIYHLPMQSTDWSKEVLQFVASVNAYFDNMRNGEEPPPIPMSKNNSFSEYCEAAERVIKTSRSCTQNAVYCWLILMHSKMCVLVGGQHSLALTWAKKALLQIKGASTGVRENRVDTYALEMEYMLLIADVHEMTGSVDKALTYLAEAKALSQGLSSIYRKVYALHAARLWIRLGSGRHTGELDVLREPFTEADCLEVSSTLGNNIDYLFTQCGEVIHGIVNELSLPTNWLSQLRFRHNHFVWDTTPCGNLSFHTAIPLASRRALNQILSSPIIMEKFNCSGVGSSHASRWSSLVTGQNKHFVGEWFDVMRDVRRRVSGDMMTPRAPIAMDDCQADSSQTDSFNWPQEEASRYLSILGFVLGAASCGTSVECSLENKADAMNERNAPLGRACRLVGSACCGDKTALADIDKLLAAPAACLSVDKCDSVYCFISMDRTSGRVLIGRKDSSSSPLVVALPLFSTFQQILADWNDIIDCNKGQLQQTSSATDVSSWGKAEKVKWWNERDQLDRRVKGFLEDMEFKLGPWRCLLAPAVQTLPLHRSRNSIGEICAGILVELFRTHSSVKAPRKKVLKKGTQTSARDPLENIDSVVEGVLEWVNLLTCANNGLETCERVAGLNDVLQAAMQHFTSGRAAGSEEHTLQAAISIINASNNQQVNEQCSDYNRDTVAGDITAMVRTTTIDPVDTLADDIRRMRERIAGLRVADLKVELKDVELDTAGKKADLLTRLGDHLETQLRRDGGTGTAAVAASIVANMEESAVGENSVAPLPRHTSRDSYHVTLILDENLQAIPWESIPLLRAASCSRVPSLSVLVNLLQSRVLSDNVTGVSVGKENKISKGAKKTARTKKHEIDDLPNASRNEDHLISVARCWYSVDPDANLERTRSTMMSFIEPYATKWQWPGYAGQRPPEDVIRKFHESSELFVYCGHGSGEKLFEKGNKLRKLKCPAAMLWGCSSGALVRHGIHDPVGASITYLLSGAPWVIGNLWDVTDRDIDRLSVSCMEKVFDEDAAGRSGEQCGRLNVSLSLCDSREVCKLKSAVGSAAVMYGLPMGMKIK